MDLNEKGKNSCSMNGVSTEEAEQGGGRRMVSGDIT